VEQTWPHCPQFRGSVNRLAVHVGDAEVEVLVVVVVSVRVVVDVL
jgi:hypothetical protein